MEDWRTFISQHKPIKFFRVLQEVHIKVVAEKYAQLLNHGYTKKTSQRYTKASCKVLSETCEQKNLKAASLVSEPNAGDIETSLNALLMR